MAQETHWISLSSGVQWRKPPCNFALEYFGYTTDITFPFLTIPVRYLGNIEYSKEKFSFGDTDPTNSSRKGSLCIDIIPPSSSVTAASRCASIGLVWAWYICIDIWKNMYARKGIIIGWKVYSDPITIIIISCLHHHYPSGIVL